MLLRPGLRPGPHWGNNVLPQTPFFEPGALPQTPPGELTALPRTPLLAGPPTQIPGYATGYSLLLTKLL